MTRNPASAHIVVLFGAMANFEGSATLDTEASHLASVLAAASSPPTLTAISLGLTQSIRTASHHLRLDDVAPSPVDRALASLGAVSLHDWAARFPIGRLCNSLGPADQGRVFWRTLRRSPAAVRALQAADLVIATDLATAKTGWIAVHRGWARSAVYDPRSAATAAG